MYRFIMLPKVDYVPIASLFVCGNPAVSPCFTEVMAKPNHFGGIA
jgi:hypothetical protein